jgi:predicted GIY-YIG superfamily endonuclease
MIEMNNEEQSYIIYKVENTKNGYVYIGATTKSVEKRKQDHIQKAKKEYQGKFQEALMSYGVENFKWEQIDTINSIDALAQKEKEYILKYNSKENGYNSDNGGGFKKTIYQYNIEDGKLVNTYDCLENAGNAINVTKKQMCSICLSVNNKYKSFYWSYKYKEPFVPKKDLRFKKVIKYSLDNIKLEEYNSVALASKANNIIKTGIARTCRKEQRQSGGFIWKYKV